MRRTLLVATLLVGIVSVGGLAGPGCKSHDDGGAGGSGAPAPLTGPIGDAEADAFGKRLIAALDPCDPAALRPLVDSDQIIDRAVRQLDVDEPTRTRLAQGARTAPHGGLVGELCTSLMAPDTGFRLLHVEHKDGVTLLLVRKLTGASVNYYRVELARSSSGTPMVADMTVFASGEPMSTSMAGVFRAGLAAASSEAEAKANAALQDRATQSLAASDWSGARAIIGQLPPALRTSKAIMMLDLQAAMHQDGDAYARALAAFNTRFPDDPSLELSSIESLYLRKDYTSLLVAIARLDSRVGGDPYLAVMRAGTLVERNGPGDLDQAEQMLVAAIAREPDLQKLHFTRIDVNLVRLDYVKVRETMETMYRLFGTKFDEATLRATRGWAGFVDSEELELWREFATKHYKAT